MALDSEEQRHFESSSVTVVLPRYISFIFKNVAQKALFNADHGKVESNLTMLMRHFSHFMRYRQGGVRGGGSQKEDANIPLTNFK